MNITKQVGLHREGSPYSEEECDQIISKLEQLLDGELDTAKEHEVKEMVHGCEFCLEQYKIEKSIRTLIKGGFTNIMASTNLVKSIKDSIKRTRNHEQEPDKV
jgi:anti-sigma factor (TIGR02949 family)